jgi:hypothetical protein
LEGMKMRLFIWIKANLASLFIILINYIQFKNILEIQNLMLFKNQV